MLALRLKRLDIFPKRNTVTTLINVGLTLSYVKLLLSSWKLYIQFDFMVHEQIVGIAMDTNCALL